MESINNKCTRFELPNKMSNLVKFSYLKLQQYVTEELQCIQENEPC